jgi:hypothetical protein
MTSVLLPPADEIYPGEYFTHMSLEEPGRGKTLTVGIGALCQEGPSIVLGADMRTTYGTSPTGPNDQTGKQYPLSPYNCAAVIAGSVSECHEFISRLAQLIQKYPARKRAPDRQDFSKAIDEARWRVYRPKLDWTMKTNFGISFAQWHKKFLPPNNINPFDPQLEFFGHLAFQQTPLKLSSIVGGFVEDHTMFFCARSAEHLQGESSPGIYAIGSGSVHAMRKLNKRGQNCSFGLARTVFHVHEAMLAARQERTVGPPNNYVVITKGEPIKWISADCQMLKDWRRAYRNKGTETLDYNPVVARMIQAQLREMKMPPYDRALPS